MNNETYEALKKVVQGARNYINRKYGDRKRLDQNETWEKATLLRDIVAVESWIEEVAKEYDDNEPISDKDVVRDGNGDEREV